MRPGALDKITILDLSRVLAGPYATMTLGDLGARVIKVEQPDRGDDTRQWGPPFTDYGESAYFFCANRNKESITVNLKHPSGRAILRDLAQQCDVLVENFKVGTLERYGLDYLSLHERNKGLIFCSITGYGQTGPYRNRPGYDSAIQAQGGIMSITGPAGKDGEPYKVGVAIVDISAGLHAAIAILAALHHRTLTGQGQAIDIALFDTQLSWLANVASSYLVSGEPPQRFGNGHASIVPYQAFATKDGWLMLAVGNDSQFRALCTLLAHPLWAEDRRFVTNPQRVKHRNVLVPLLEDVFRSKSTNEWMDGLQASGVPCSPVNDIPSALSDPQAMARNMVQTIEHPVSGPIPQLGPVAKLSETPAVIGAPPPTLGQHTEAILREFLDCDAVEIRRLRLEQII
jgi:crotonobetainyl-CoA:carnitine CoA-transferase CaiB-like acyl-CoA transferase